MGNQQNCPVDFCHDIDQFRLLTVRCNDQKLLKRLKSHVLNYLKQFKNDKELKVVINHFESDNFF